MRVQHNVNAAAASSAGAKNLLMLVLRWPWLATFEFLVAAAAALASNLPAAPSSDPQYCAASGIFTTDDLARDEQILLAFKGEVTDRDNMLLNWDPKLGNGCSWTGVECDVGINRVSQLKMASFGLEGSLTPIIGCLEFLHTIDLTNNSFSGSIPPGLFRNCSALKYVKLSLNHFSGAVPDTIGNCLAVTELKLSRNALSGSIPNALTNLTSLSSVDFSSNQLTGEIPHIPSSPGTVYKGVLPVFPFVIAVKKFNDDEEGRRRLDREAKIMKLIRHRNLVRSLGVRSSSDPGFQVPGLNVLVLEYVEKGTLDQLLYGNPVQESFSWDMRVSIAVDVATGLCYLHEDVGNNIQVIHGDIKPSNIFIKSNFQASIGDFGLARLAVNGKATNQTAANRCWEGTFGYMAPELAQGYMSTAGDVYSFGIVILEMLVRRRPNSFDTDNANSNFVPWIRDSFPGDLEAIIDRSLVSELETNGESVRLMFKVGLLCTVDTLWDRPTMTEALVMINSISSRSRTRGEQVVVSPILALAQAQEPFPNSAQLRNARNLKVLAGMLDSHDFSIDIYDPSRTKSISCFSTLYLSSRDASKNEEAEFS